MRTQFLSFAVLAGCIASGLAIAADVDVNTKIGGQVFFDFGNIKQQQNGNDAGSTGTGFDVKRFYLVADHTFNDVWSANFTADAQYLNSSTSTITTTTGTPPATTTVVTAADSRIRLAQKAWTSKAALA